MSLIPYKITAIRSDDDGSGKNIVPFASVSILTEVGAVASVFSNSAGSVLSNPFTLDANGEKTVWVEPGIYQTSIAGGVYFSTYISSATTEDFTSVEKNQLARTLVFPSPEAGQTFPVADSRANTFLWFDENGFLGFPSYDEVREFLNVEDGATANATDSQLRERSTHTGQQAISTVTGLQTELDTKLLKSSVKPNIASPNSSDAASTLAVADALANANKGQIYKGLWNSLTNTPTIISSTGIAGNFYDVSVASDGVTTIDGIDEWPEGSKIIFNGSIWEKNTAPNVRSVDGRIGDVVLNYNTVVDLAATNLPVGAKVSTKGCIFAGDGGHANFIKEVASGTPDGYSRILDAGGGHLVLLPVNGCVDIHQFGIGSNLAAALLRADAYCKSTSHRLVGSGSAVLSSAVTIEAPYIDLSGFAITLANSFPSAVAVTYQATSSNLESTSHVKLRFEGNKDNQSSEIIACQVRATPSADSIFYIFGRRCNTLLNVDGNIERGEFHVKGNFCNIICTETGDAPDTNVFYISGGQYKQAYVKTVSTTSDVYFNCQSQEVGATVYAIQINGNRHTKLSGELRAVTYGAVIAGDDPAFARQSWDSLVFDNLSIQYPYTVGAPATINIQEANYVCGRVIIAGGIPQPALLGDIASANLEIAMMDCDYIGTLVQFGIQSTSKACQGSYRVINRGSQVGASALFDRVGDINVSFDGSALPITITSSVTSGAIGLSLGGAYISNNVPISHNGVRANVNFRGQHLTVALLAYLTAATTAGIPRGANAWNVNTNGLNFFDGTVWKYAPATTTLA